MDLALHFRIAGCLLFLLAAIHVFFPRYFRWPEELSRLSRLNQQIFVVHMLFIVLVVVMCATLFTVFTRHLIEPTPLAAILLAGLAIFWGLRLIVQWFVYDRRLWWGQPFNTAIHLIFTALWSYITLLCGWALYLQLHTTAR